MAKSFVNLDTLVSSVLLGIGDEQNKRYEVKATQWILDTIRRVHVNYSPYYKEERVYFDNEDIYSIDYPKDLVKLLSVGIYQNDVFWPFTKKQDLSILTTGSDGDEFDYEAYISEKLESMPKPATTKTLSLLNQTLTSTELRRK